MFISFEGLDGSGKTTQLRLLVEHLQAHGYSVCTTREPGGTSIGDQIRDVLHSLENTEMHPHTEVLLYVASRAQLVGQIIRPQLEANTIVISDRFADSTLAYQGYGHGLDLVKLRHIIDFATGGLKPDITVYLDISVETGLTRRQRGASQGEEWNRLDAQQIDFYQRVAQGYSQMMVEDPERWLVIDGQGTTEEVQARLQERLLPRLTRG